MSDSIASLSLDLDNKWSYLKTHGNDSWRTYPSYLDRVVPRFLSVLGDLDLKMTVFVVGQDAQLEENREPLVAIARAGHEIGNHSFHHEPWLHRYSPAELEHEFESAEQAIIQVTGLRPIGFRGPGFSLTDQVLKILAQRGYRYDASTFPTFLGPLARAYYFAKSSLNRQDRQERKALFGRFQDGFQSLRPFFWQTGESRILEIPVTTMPIFKTPIHASYLLYLASFSQSAAKAYFWQAIQLCRLFRVQPSLLLHPLDFIGCELDPELAFFPGMNLPTETKTGLMRKFLRMYSDSFQVVSMRDHAAAAATDKRITQRPIQLARAGAEG